MNYIHSSAKHRRSGSTMQQMPRRGEHKRALLAREVLPGYPWLGRFSSRADVDAYLAGDEITCLLCGKPYIFLAPHTGRVHDLKVADYKERFGIPQKRGINGKHFGQVHREHALARKFGQMAPEVRERIRYKAPRKVREHVPFVRWEMIARVNGGDRDRCTYSDFTWHLEQAATVFAYRDVPPPAGHASWSAFKKRRRKNATLQSAFKAARIHRMAQRSATLAGDDRG